jgi:aspartate/tyrosine/aromatic aminotransferase
MFERLPLAPPDAIFDLAEQHARDARPDKINLTMGVFQDEQGETPILTSVRRAERQLAETETTKTYLGLAGCPRFNRAIERLMFGDELVGRLAGRLATIQTPGASAALRIVGELVAGPLERPAIWLSNPTWANHAPIFRASRLAIETYPYTSPRGEALDADRMLAAIGDLARGSVVLLQACCHNPTGFDLNADQWREIAGLAERNGLLLVLDFAYQGFAESPVADARPLGQLAEAGVEFLVCYSCSKNFGLYGERVGALSAVCATPAAAQAMLSQVKSIARVLYSNSPRHGAGIVATILNEPVLRDLWLVELAAMRDRIAAMRSTLVEQLRAIGPDFDFSHLAVQRGMFGYLGLSPEQVDRLRVEHGIYMLRTSRINVAGLNARNISAFAESLAAVAAAPSTSGV